LRVRFTPSGRAQFLAALQYIRADRPIAARRFLSKAAVRLQRLETHPLSGRVIPEFPRLPHRELLVPPFRFIYKIQGRAVWIVGVWHTSQRARKPE
jgi:toxin ParE1/3/4